MVLNNSDKDRWYTFLLAIIIVLLGAMGGLVMVLNSQTWNKLDRMTSLFLHERDLLSIRMEKTNDEIRDLQQEHQKDMKIMIEKMSSGTNGTKK